MDDDEIDDDINKQIPNEPVPSEVATEHQEAWRRVLDRLKPEVGEEASNWLRELAPHLC